MTEEDFPGQLITEEGGFTFKHDPGAKGGEGVRRSQPPWQFLVMDVGDEHTPTGIYVKAWKRSDFLYADTYAGAAACIIAYQYRHASRYRRRDARRGDPGR
ncbi:hypothetical protein [Streptomyces reniochalinae]